MLKKDQVLLMTKLAVMEKNKSKEEKMAENYFQSDYVYINNWQVRISITFVYLIIAGFYYFTQIFTQNMNVLDLNVTKLLSMHLLLYSFIMVAFTFLSSAIFKARYQRAEEKNKRYLQMLKELEEMRKEG